MEAQERDLAPVSPHPRSCTFAVQRPLVKDMQLDVDKSTTRSEDGMVVATALARSRACYVRRQGSLPFIDDKPPADFEEPTHISTTCTYHNQPLLPLDGASGFQDMDMGRGPAQQLDRPTSQSKLDYVYMHTPPIRYNPTDRINKSSSCTNSGALGNFAQFSFKDCDGLDAIAEATAAGGQMRTAPGSCATAPAPAAAAAAVAAPLRPASGVVPQPETLPLTPWSLPYAPLPAPTQLIDRLSIADLHDGHSETLLGSEPQIIDLFGDQLGAPCCRAPRTIGSALIAAGPPAHLDRPNSLCPVLPFNLAGVDGGGCVDGGVGGEIASGPMVPNCQPVNSAPAAVLARQATIRNQCGSHLLRYRGCLQGYANSQSAPGGGSDFRAAAAGVAEPDALWGWECAGLSNKPMPAQPNGPAWGWPQLASDTRACQIMPYDTRIAMYDSGISVDKVSSGSTQVSEDVGRGMMLGYPQQQQQEEEIRYGVIVEPACVEGPNGYMPNAALGFGAAVRPPSLVYGAAAYDTDAYGTADDGDVISRALPSNVWLFESLEPAGARGRALEVQTALPAEEQVDLATAAPVLVERAQIGRRGSSGLAARILGCLGRF